MDLWIRSQDKKILTKANSFWVMENQIWMEVPFYENIKRIGLTVTGHNRKLATYETEERTLEVLDEIQDRLDYVDIVDLGKHEAVIGGNMIYEMPEE